MKALVLQDGRVLAMYQDFDVSDPLNVLGKATANTVDLILQFENAQEYSIVDGVDKPEGFRPGVTRYVNGAFTNLTHEHGRLVATEMVKRWPAMMQMTVAQKVAFANEVKCSRKMGITEFFMQCIAVGADPADFKPIWGFYNYKQEVNDAINNGELEQIQAYIYTMPWDVSGATAAALQTIIAAIALTRSQFVCLDMGLEPSLLTEADFLD